MFFAKRVTASHIGGEPEADMGGISAADCVFACEFRFGAEAAELSFVLREQGDTFRAELRRTGEEQAKVQVFQRWRGGDELLLTEGSLSIAAEGWTGLRFGNIDNAVFFELLAPGLEPELLRSGLTSNHLDPSDRLAKGETYGHRLSFGGAVGTADFRRIRVFRDLHYTDRGVHGTTQPVRLGPRDFFVLGDNSPESRDGRDWGPIQEEEILGRPLSVVLPLGAFRSLGDSGQGLVAPRGPFR